MAERQTCPTCGAVCEVVGDTTLHYEPIGDIDRLEALLKEHLALSESLLQQQVKDLQAEVKEVSHFYAVSKAANLKRYPALERLRTVAVAAADALWAVAEGKRAVDNSLKMVEHAAVYDLLPTVDAALSHRAGLNQLAEVERLRQQVEDREKRIDQLLRESDQAQGHRQQMAIESEHREIAALQRAGRAEQALATEQAGARELRRLLTEFRVVMGGQQTGSFHAEDLVPVWLEACAYLDNAALATDAGKGEQSE